MALFDKLKEKVKETTDSIKKEVAKAVDPSIREQEQLEKEKALQEEKEKAIEAFWESNNLNEELDYIFSILEKSDATVSNFEKGFEHFFSKTGTSLTKEEILPTMKKALFARAFNGDCAIAKTVAVDYFIREVVKGEMLSQYMRFAIAKEKYPTAEMMGPFVKVLYGVAGHAFNYHHNSLASENYQVMTPDAFKPIIEHSDTLKSYTDGDPFTVDDVREKWANDMYDSPLKMVRSSTLGSMLDNEKHIDEMCYCAYTILRQDNENGVENVSVTAIAVAYMNFLKEIYDRLNH